MGWLRWRADCAGFIEDSLSRLLLYLNTLRYLKLAQIWGRLAFKLKQSRPDLRPAPVFRYTDGGWQCSASRQISMLGPSSFRFLNKEHILVSADDWNSLGLPKLWLYNLHYFDDLNAFGAAERNDWHKALIARWLTGNPPAEGNGWESYPLSLRIVNWFKWALAGNILSEDALHSLAIQTRFLASHIERHLLGNHLFANAKALVFAGCLFEGEEAGKWLRLGMNIIAYELPEQILDDGGHFERSTMYHALAFEDMLDLINLTKAYSAVFAPWLDTITSWSLTVTGMGKWLAAMCHPDEEISFFNDSAIGIAPSPAELFSYAARLNLEVARSPEKELIWMKQSGYVSVKDNGAVLIVDVAPVGPDYLPAHAHADTLSFEFSLAGDRLFVNTGTSLYGIGREREWQRSTAAHNTVEIDTEDSSEVWAGFRVARRAYPFDIKVAETDDAITITASHNGYLRLPVKSIHRRKWLFSSHSLIVKDEIVGDEFRGAVARFYLHPLVQVVSNNIKDGRVVLQLPCGQKVDLEIEGGRLDLNVTTWHPSFGVSDSNLCLSVSFQSATVKTKIGWQEEGS